MRFIRSHHLLCYVCLQDPVSGDNAIFIQQVLPGSTADQVCGLILRKGGSVSNVCVCVLCVLCVQCKDLKAGDRVLAIDGQLLDGTDYPM